jgi:hypothetical protein
MLPRAVLCCNMPSSVATKREEGAGQLSSAVHSADTAPFKSTRRASDALPRRGEAQRLPVAFFQELLHNTQHSNATWEQLHTSQDECARAKLTKRTRGHARGLVYPRAIYTAVAARFRLQRKRTLARGRRTSHSRANRAASRSRIAACTAPAVLAHEKAAVTHRHHGVAP